MIVSTPSAGGAHRLCRNAVTRAGHHVHDLAARPTIESPTRIVTARHALTRTVTGMSGALAAEHHLLGAGWYARQRRLERPQQRQRTWKEKKKVSREDVEPGAVQQVSRVAGRQRFRIAIERDPAHHQTCARIPRIVLPEREVRPGRQRATDIRERPSAKTWLDVMKHAVAVREVELAGRLVFVDRAELHVRVGVVAARQIDALP